MRLPFAQYGVRELGVASAILLPAFVVSAWLLPRPMWALSMVFPVLWVGVLWFFRDPVRYIPDDSRSLLSPADGRVVEIEKVEEPLFIGGPSIKIGIFLSILDVHINRAPCGGRVVFLRYQPGLFWNALRPEAARVNESNFIGIEAEVGNPTRLLVRQIAGAIARRIVCDCRLDDLLKPGQKIGMIKFGSRTEVYIPADARFRPLVKVGEKVRAGESVLGVFE